MPTGPYVTSGTTYAITPSGISATQFRFAGGTANVAFVDGHVETRTMDKPSVAPFDQTAWNTASDKFQLGFLADTTVPYSGD
ncbi:H-X9-DG-CTERM domain-containing protein [Limnoglobus roseus]|uniref:Uncharacterized protein n=1 Tax=Limnoglobus roseus TaxID=2598579 RepID=A0A5C1ADQ6_9BACT|nr:H-X9-DG-CTERM domain-containing protein [Limnoglobus roseus]QEL15198.1 hypothetical protein PX52LOC_02113 [Limnoglobus roseus]